VARNNFISTQSDKEGMGVRTYLVYSTCEDMENARRIAESLIKERLAACVNIIPSVYSIYWWKGKIEEGEEVPILVKTSKVNETIERIKELHTYELPDIIAIPIERGFKRFLEYIVEETSL
jgi:periplasmic divalent cation tolerance protein